MVTTRPPKTIVKPTAVPSIYSSARRRVSANFDNTSKIRAFGSVRIFGDDAKGLSFGTGRGPLGPTLWRRVCGRVTMMRTRMQPVQKLADPHSVASNGANVGSANAVDCGLSTAPSALRLFNSSAYESYGPMQFRVEVDPAAAGTVTVDYATANRTSGSDRALAGQDYYATSGTLTFAPGETAKFVVVGIIDDAVRDGGETFYLNLSNATGATLADGHNQQLRTAHGELRGRARGARRAERLQLPGRLQRRDRDQLPDAARRVLHDDGRRGNRRTARQRAQRPVGDHGRAIGRGKCDDHAPPGPRLRHDRGRLHRRGHAEVIFKVDGAHLEHTF